MKTSIPRHQEQDEKQWYCVDASGQILGRLAVRIADILRGKHKVRFTPHMDMGDHVIVVHAEKIAVTGAKLDQKRYYRHSGYPGNLKVTPLRKKLAVRPREVIELAVRGMLPKNRLRERFMSKLHVYSGAEHPHEAQQPVALTL